MPPHHSRIYCALLLLIFAWIITTVTGEAVQYGMRIKPLKRVMPSYQAPEYCPSCENKTTIKSDRNLPRNTQNAKITTKRVGEISKDDNDKFKYPINPLVKIQQTASPIYSAFPPQNSSGGTTFFFTQLEPHRFEYRAMFQHHQNNFQPFVHDFEPFSRNYPPLPKFPAFPDFPDFFQNHKNSLAKLPEFSFPTLPPEIKRVWNHVPENEQPLKSILPKLPEPFDNPLVKNYDIVLGHANYPKIFRFNEERMNIEDFDRQKKIRYYNLAKNGHNVLEEPENVKRDHLLILHGGIFTVKEPPLFNKQHIKKRRKLGSFGRHGSHFIH